ncbi:rhodanese-like domain-containing protein [Raineyella fluvialis]|uniref:rhodanese-like domain-containing protein n=1 Tax=Raineyella fluvialis TaxID=2662261 RepID=UPI0018900330
MVLLDVRDDWEREIITVPDDLWVPLSEVRASGWQAVEETLDGAVDVVVYCRSGARSAEAIRLLQAGAPEGVRLRNLTGGVLAWAREFGGPSY